MSSNSIVRIAGIAGILSVVLSLAVYASAGPTGAPSGPLSVTLGVLSNLAGIIFVVGLYLVYRAEAAMLSLVAVAISIVGGLLFIYATLFMSFDFSNPLMIIADMSVFIVGLGLFTWLGYQSRKMPRFLSIVGLLAVLAGVGVYVLKLGAGVDAMSTPTAPLAGVASIFYYAYFLLAFGWVAWTGYVLLSSKTKTAMATA